MSNFNHKLYPHFVGFNQLFENMERLALTGNRDTSYPPYNVISTDNDTYIVELAVAGFVQDELSVTQHKGELIIEGSQATTDEEPNYVHKGIGSRSFRRSFTLADHVQVDSVTVKNGIMSIHLSRELPEELKPKTLAIAFEG